MFGPLPWRLNGAGWAAARGHVRISDRLDPLADAKETMWGGGLSLGLMIERLGTSEDVRRIGTGFGFMVNGEWLWLPSDEYPPGSDHELLLSVGVFVRFSKFRV